MPNVRPTVAARVEHDRRGHRPRLHLRRAQKRDNRNDDESGAAGDREQRADAMHRHARRRGVNQVRGAVRRLARRAVAAGGEHAERSEHLPAAIE